VKRQTSPIKRQSSPKKRSTSTFVCYGGWEMHSKDSSSGQRQYYYHEATGTTRWKVCSVRVHVRCPLHEYFP
jgi:hypothetical protein